MEPSSAIWGDPVVRAAHAAGDLGAIVRAVRQARHLTLADVAQRCGYSVSTLSRLETGRQPLRDVQVLRRLAEALRIPPRLVGLADTPRCSVQVERPAAKVGATLVPDEETDPMRRRTLLAGLSGLAGTAVLGASSPRQTVGDPIGALEKTLLEPSMGGVPTSIAHLTKDVARTRAVFQRGSYTDVAACLPGLLSTAMATRGDATNSNGVASACGQLAELYTLCSELMVKLGHDHLAWTTADRGLQAAYSSGDILTQATAKRVWAIVLRRAGRPEIAQRLVVDTAAALQSDLAGGPEYLSVYGSLLSTAAYTAAVDGDRDTARVLIAEAVDAAGQLGVDGNHRSTAFGPTGVDLYRISIARVLGDSGTAVEVARRVNPASILFGERQARYWSDVARAFHQWGRPEQCYQALLAAEHASPDEVRYRKPIQEITTSLLRQPNARALPGLRAFARRTGISA